MGKFQCDAFQPSDMDECIFTIMAKCPACHQCITLTASLTHMGPYMHGQFIMSCEKCGQNVRGSNIVEIKIGNTQFTPITSQEQSERQEVLINKWSYLWEEVEWLIQKNVAVHGVICPKVFGQYEGLKYPPLRLEHVLPQVRDIKIVFRADEAMNTDIEHDPIQCSGCGKTISFSQAADCRNDGKKSMCRSKLFCLDTCLDMHEQGDCPQKKSEAICAYCMRRIPAREFFICCHDAWSPHPPVQCLTHCKGKVWCSRKCRDTFHGNGSLSLAGGMRS